MRSEGVLTFLLCVSSAMLDEMERVDRVDMLSSLLEHIFNSSNVWEHNFVVAPHEALKLYERLSAPAPSSNEAENADDDTDIYERSYKAFTMILPSPVQVTNRLLADAASTPASVTELRARLPHVRVLTSLGRNGTHAPTTLINAVTLHSRWACNFQRRDTHKYAFYATPQTHVYVDALRKDDMYRYLALPELNASALQICLQRHDHKLLVLLPDEMDGLPLLEQQLSRNWSYVEALVQQHFPLMPVRLILPKFHISYTLNLSQVLAQLAQPHGGDIANETEIRQHVQLRFSERGIGEPQRSTVYFWNIYTHWRITPVQFNINRPFLFLIHNKQGIQFLGHLVELK